MAQPTAYNRIASFANLQALAPSDPPPGATVDAEFNAIKQTLDQLLANLALIQADDGGLENGVVDRESFDADVEIGWSAPEVWVTATAYVVGSTVFRGSGFYRCLVAHTAGTFATDLTASKWELIVDLSALTIVAASQIANTPAGTIAATTVQAAIDELASEKAASSHTHPSSALTDSTAAGRAMLAAANVAAQQTLLGLGDLAFLDNLTVTEIDAQIALTGIIEPTALAVDTNDWAPTGIATVSTIRMSASVVGVDLTGLLAPATDGEIKILENVGTSFPVTLSPSSASSAAANRFLIPKPIIVGPNSSVALRYDLGDARWRLLDNVARLPRGHIAGLVVSNGTDATNDIDVAAGECRGARGILDLVVTTAIGKQLDADWTAGGTTGTPLGGRYVTSANDPAIANTTYHGHLIGKADGTVDVLLYTGTDPTSVLPTGFIDYRRIFSIIRVSGSIRLFTQVGDYFRFKGLSTDLNDATITTSSSTGQVLNVPVLGVDTPANVLCRVVHASSTTNIYLRHPSDTDETPGSIKTSAQTLGSGAEFNTVIPVVMNSAAQIAVRSTNSSTTVSLAALGYTDRRGKDS